tara:strand:- start:28 stop:744 length:717 start_codon:yes stop_codon:yes gene_type:complete
MNNTTTLIPVANLTVGLIPACAVLIVLFLWKHEYPKALYAFGRMVLQLMLIGYFLNHLFGSDSAALAVTVLAIMLIAASWISIRSSKQDFRRSYPITFASIAIGGGTTLIVVTQGVLVLDPWYQASVMIPLAGMIFSSAMNSVSLTVERFNAELRQGKEYYQARATALQAALIPITNSLLAVGLVSLPGMMTGQILSGVEPLIAVRYQIMVMCMAYGSAGISTICYLTLARKMTILTV